MSGQHEDEFCYYCGEPLEDGLCSGQCEESAADEGRDEAFEEEEDYEDGEYEYDDEEPLA